MERKESKGKDGGKVGGREKEKNGWREREGGRGEEGEDGER